MRENKPSSTAQIVALLRAVLSSPEIALVDDPYADSLLSQPYRLLSRTFQGWQGRPALASFDVATAGVVSMLAGRTRFFDDAIKAAIAAGVRQVVLLGAGYDARALRLASDGVRFFEVDHPATQADKKQKLSRLGIEDHATFVTVDFTKDKLQDRLLASGFVASKPTFFLWEGVIMYLSEEQVRGTLRALYELAAHGSKLSFDCVRGGTSLLDDAIATVGKISFGAFFGEPLDFRANPEPLRDILLSERWELSEIASIKELHQRYLSGGPMISPRDMGFVALASVQK
jgi:methyltransferase (TIGR00027 family)